MAYPASTLKLYTELLKQASIEVGPAFEEMFKSAAPGKALSWLSRKVIPIAEKALPTAEKAVAPVASSASRAVPGFINEEAQNAFHAAMGKAPVQPVTRPVVPEVDHAALAAQKAKILAGDPEFTGQFNAWRSQNVQPPAGMSAEEWAAKNTTHTPVTNPAESVAPAGLGMRHYLGGAAALGGAGAGAYYLGKGEGEANKNTTRNLAFGAGAATGLALPRVMGGLGNAVQNLAMNPYGVG